MVASASPGAVSTAAVTAPPKSRLLESIARVNAAYPVDRKRLLGVDVNHGRELLLALARDTGGWVGWEATTLRTIADALALVPLHERGLRTASDVELTSFITVAFERAIDAGLVDAQFASMMPHRGFRSALEDSILELRMAGVTPAELHDAAPSGSPSAQLVPVFQEYASVLAEHFAVDPAGVFLMALEAFDAEAPFVLDGVTTLAPTLTSSGVTGALVRKLVDAGAILLDVDRAMPRPDDPSGVARLTTLLSQQTDAFARSVLGWSLATRVPTSADAEYNATFATVDLFAGATPSEELREVCRRVLREGLRWDDVEIVTTDPDAYGIALDALCQQLGIGATMLKGIPLIRTRIGRALERWFTWLGNGLPSDVLRQAIEAGEIPVRAADIDAHDVAVELRAQRIGWGRARYDALLERLSVPNDTLVADRGNDESESDRLTRRQAKSAREAGLADVMRALLPLTPTVPERGRHLEVRATSARLAAATLSYIARLELRDGAEEQTMERLRRRLGRLAELDEEETDFETALVGLRGSLADLRAWPPTGMARKPYRADGGLLHLTDLPHAGSSGRARTFVVGLDVERTSGTTRQDPLVPDAVRRAIGRDRLPDSADRRAQWLERLGVSLSSLRGRVTLSWAVRGADGRDAGPSPLLLQVCRVLENDPLRTFEQLRAHVMPPACAVPTAADANDPGVLDARDVWLRAIGSAASMLDATAVVRTAFPMLDAGLTARERAASADLTAYHGIVPTAGVALDPTLARAPTLSPSGLETLGKCPLQWFYKYGLGLRPPQDPEYDAEAWLDPLQRGSLLHEVFEIFVRTYLGSQATIVEASAAARLDEIAQSTIDKWRELLPPPGDTVCATESAELHRAARAFLQMEREALANGDVATWTSIEYGFGDSTRAQFTLTGGGTIALLGRADRIDTFPDGSLRVVDYKTGKPTPYRSDSKKAAFNGGRLLQPALYAEAIGGAMQRTVSRFEYRFPTDRGGNAIIPFDAAALVAARGVVTSLVDHVRTGRFLPTNDANDCKHCDHAPICRVQATEFTVSSPRAEWATRHAEALPEYASMLARRGRVVSEDGE